MDANRLTFPTELSPQKLDRSVVLQLRLPAPVPNRPTDAAHEHWPKDYFHAKQRERAGKEHCPSEVYIG